MSGTFTIFVDDVVVHAEGEGRTWSELTGYREDDPGGPATGYEFRVTTVRVENGTLDGISAGAFAFYAPQVKAQIDGTLSVNGVSGRLLHPGQLDVFHEAHSGSMARECSRSVANGRMGPSLGRRRTCSWDMHGDFEMSGAGAVTRDPTPSQVRGEGLLSWVSIGGLAVVGMGGLMVLDVVPGPTPRSRRRRHRRWMLLGERARAAEDWPRAERCYRRATRLRRDDPLAWSRWAVVALEGGDPNLAEEVARQAADVSGIDPADLLDLRAVAALERGDEPAFLGFPSRVLA